MTEFKIKEYVPGIKGKYPFNEMEIGDSLIANGDDERITKVSAAARSWGRYKGRKFRVSKNENSVVIWRIE